MGTPIRWHIFVILLLPLLSGCIHLPSHSTETIDHNLSIVKPLETGEAILVHGNKGSYPDYSLWGDYFTLRCMGDFQDATVKQLTRYLLMLNPLPDQFVITTLDEVQGVPPIIKFSDPFPKEVNISEAKAVQERLRYVIFINEYVDTTLHIPFYLCPFGFIACGNESALEASIWEVPSGSFVGSIRSSSKGEFVVLAWMLHVIFIPQTQSEATLKLAQEILKTLTGLTPDEKKIPSWQYR